MRLTSLLADGIHDWFGSGYALYIFCTTFIKHPPSCPLRYGKDVLRLLFRVKGSEPRSLLSFRRFGNQLAGYALEMPYCHRNLFDVRIDKEYNRIYGLWIPKAENRESADARSAEIKVTTEVKKAEEAGI